MVRINVPASKDLLPGMFVNVQFPFKNSGNVNQDFQEGVMIPKSAIVENGQLTGVYTCLLYTSDAADERSSVDLGGRRIIKKKKNKKYGARRHNIKKIVTN